MSVISFQDARVAREQLARDKVECRGLDILSMWWDETEAAGVDWQIQTVRNLLHALQAAKEIEDLA